MSRTLTCAVLFLGLSLGAAGCASPIGVTRWSPEQAAQQSYANALDSDHPTSFTIQTLLRLNLYEKFKDDPGGALAELHKGLAPAGDEDRLFALAELSLLHARKTASQPHFTDRRLGSQDRACAKENRQNHKGESRFIMCASFCTMLTPAASPPAWCVRYSFFALVGQPFLQSGLPGDVSASPVFARSSRL